VWAALRNAAPQDAYLARQLPYGKFQGHIRDLILM
jgi:hypothetical protein